MVLFCKIILFQENLGTVLNLLYQPRNQKLLIWMRLMRKVGKSYKAISLFVIAHTAESDQTFSTVSTISIIA